MNRQVLYISSCRENVADEFSFIIRELGRRMQRPLWGKSFSPAEEIKKLLYLDSGGRGNLDIMARSMDARAIEFVFSDKDTGRRVHLLSEILKSEYSNGEYVYKSTKEAFCILTKRVEFLDGIKRKMKVFAVNETPFERSVLYSGGKSDVRRKIVNGFFCEGKITELYSEDIPDVILSDAFTKNGVLAILQKRLGNPSVIHIMNREKDIYAPFMSTTTDVFIPTEDFLKEVLTVICAWLSDIGEEKCSQKLYNSFISLKGGEELIRRAICNFMKKTKRRENYEY